MYLLAFFLILSIIALVFFIAFGVFTKIDTGTEKYVTKGGQYMRTVQANDKRFWLWEFFGVHFAGFSFQNYGWKQFTVNTDKENPYADKSDPDTWLQKGDARQVDFLLIEMPRMLVAKGLEIGGTTGQPLQVDLGIQLLFERALDKNKESMGYRFVFYFNADYNVPTGMVLSMIRARIAKFNKYDDLTNAPDDILDFLTIDKGLTDNLEHFGLNLIKAKIAFIATDQTLEKAARAKTEAEMIGEAKIATAEAEATAIRVLGLAEAEATKNKGIAEVEAVVETLKKNHPNVSEDDLLKMATDILSKKSLPPNLTTLITDLIRK